MCTQLWQSPPQTNICDLLSFVISWLQNYYRLLQTGENCCKPTTDYTAGAVIAWPEQTLTVWEIHDATTQPRACPNLAFLLHPSPQFPPLRHPDTNVGTNAGPAEDAAGPAARASAATGPTALRNTSTATERTRLYPLERSALFADRMEEIREGQKRVGDRACRNAGMCCVPPLQVSRL